MKTVTPDIHQFASRRKGCQHVAAEMVSYAASRSGIVIMLASTISTSLRFNKIRSSTLLRGDQYLHVPPIRASLLRAVVFSVMKTYDNILRSLLLKPTSPAISDRIVHDAFRFQTFACLEQICNPKIIT